MKLFSVKSKHCHYNVALLKRDQKKTIIEKASLEYYMCIYRVNIRYNLRSPIVLHYLCENRKALLPFTRAGYEYSEFWMSSFVGLHHNLLWKQLFFQMLVECYNTDMIVYFSLLYSITLVYIENSVEPCSVQLLST